MAYLIDDLRGSNQALKRPESKKLAEKLARDLLDIDSDSDEDNGTVAQESVKTHD